MKKAVGQFNQKFKGPFAVFTTELDGTILAVEPCNTRHEAEELVRQMTKAAQMFEKLLFMAERIN